MSFLPSASRRYLTERAIAFQEVEDGPQRGVLLNSFPLPPGRFQAASADILILLPQGFPDACPDMFYASPRLLLLNGAVPRATEVNIVFGGVTWQRWSRHSGEWRSGVDGLHTMIKRVEQALENAA